MKPKWHVAAAVIVGLLSITAAGGAMAIYQNTIVRWWIPGIWAFSGASVMLPLFIHKWKFITGRDSRWLNIPVHYVVFTSVLWFAVLFVNHQFRVRDTEHEEKVTIVQKYIRSHTRYRRLTRGRMVPSGNYNTHHVTVRFDNGVEKPLEISLKVYNRTKKGSHATFHLEKGLFGYPVITSKGRLAAR